MKTSAIKIVQSLFNKAIKIIQPLFNKAIKIIQFLFNKAIKIIQFLFNKAIEIVQSLFNKKNVNKLKNNLNKKTISLAVIILFVLITSSYFIRPIFFDYKLGNKKVIEKKIKNNFKS